MNPDKQIRIMVVDDHACIIRGIQACLSGEERLAIVGQASNGCDAIDEAHKLVPDIVLMDLVLPRLDGAGAMMRIRAHLPQVRMIAYTMHESAEMVQKAIRSGASGYVLKASPLTVLVSAIEAVMDGGTYFDPALPTHSHQSIPNVGSPDFSRSCFMPSGEEVNSSPSHQGMNETPGLIAECKLYIRENLSPLLTVKELSASFGKNPSDLNRMFWRETGETIKTHIDNLCRLNIEQRLRESDCKGSQLAFEFGFRDDQAFYRWIQRVFGMPFRELREIHATNQTKPNQTKPNQTKPNQTKGTFTLRALWI